MGVLLEDASRTEDATLARLGATGFHGAFFFPNEVADEAAVLFAFDACERRQDFEIHPVRCLRFDRLIFVSSTPGLVLGGAIVPDAIQGLPRC
jgi:hypothetical protein